MEVFGCLWVLLKINRLLAESVCFSEKYVCTDYNRSAWFPFFSSDDFSMFFYSYSSGRSNSARPRGKNEDHKLCQNLWSFYQGEKVVTLITIANGMKVFSCKDAEFFVIWRVTDFFVMLAYNTNGFIRVRGWHSYKVVVRVGRVGVEGWVGWRKKNSSSRRWFAILFTSYIRTYFPPCVREIHSVNLSSYVHTFVTKTYFERPWLKVEWHILRKKIVISITFENEAVQTRVNHSKCFKSSPLMESYRIPTCRTLINQYDEARRCTNSVLNMKLFPV